jgi:hypothetical protein
MATVIVTMSSKAASSRVAGRGERRCDPDRERAWKTAGRSDARGDDLAVRRAAGNAASFEIGQACDEAVWNGRPHEV